MSDAPWRDALRRAKSPATAASPGPAPAASAGSPSRAAPARGGDPAALSPDLARLMAERRALESRMAGLTGQGGLDDPRYAVSPLDRRRAELERWGAARDLARGTAPPRPPSHPPAQPPPLRATASDSLRPTPGEAVRPTPGQRVRRTPGDLPPDQRQYTPMETFERQRATPRENWERASRDNGERATPRETWERAARENVERATPRENWERAVTRRQADPLAEPSRRLAAMGQAGRGLREAGRALRDADERPRTPATEPLDRRLDKARDMVSRGRKTYAAAERSLDAARDAIPNDWVERARERIPGLGRADPYVRETARKLSVAVGTMDELGDKADRLREMASDVRELREADAARDDARRDRALERLKAKRSDSSEGGA